MASRDPYEPRYHKASKRWYKKINGVWTALGYNYRDAKRQLRIIMEATTEREREEARANRQFEPHTDWIERPFNELADEYLADQESRRKPATFTTARYNLDRAFRHLPPGLIVGEVRKFHLAMIERELSADGTSPTTIYATLSAVQAVFCFAVRTDLLRYNPLTGYEKPAPRGRTRLLTDREFHRLLAASSLAYRRVLVCLRHTGCRPGELRVLTWEMVDLDRGLWVIPDHKTVTRQRTPRPRIVPLSNEVMTVCHRLAKKPHNQTDHVFLNDHGKPYSKDRLVQNFDRARKRAKINVQNGENLVLYSSRHTLATDAVGRIHDTELAELLGHTDTRMLRKYVHLSAERIRDIGRRSRVEKSSG